MNVENGNRLFTNSNAQWIQLEHNNLNLNNNRITNLANPVNATDAVTKQYLDNYETAKANKAKYQKVLDDLKPKFWVSSTFPNGLDGTASTITDLTGNGLTVTGSIPSTLIFPVSTRIQSTTTFDKEFTFLIKAKKVSSTAKGRFFTSHSGNKLLGWWNGKIKSLYMDANVYGVTSNTTTGDSKTHTFMLVGNNDLKAFYHEKTTVVSSNNGSDTWGKVVLGQPWSPSTENTEFQLYECICFDKVLLETEELFKLYDDIFA